MNWQPIETAPKRQKLLVAFQNPLGNWRRTIACYYPKGTLEMHEDAFYDYGEPEDGDGFAPEGWYEETYENEYIQRLSCQPLHWMPLPPCPSDVSDAADIAIAESLKESLCEGCPPAEYPDAPTRCLPCPRRSPNASAEPQS